MCISALIAGGASLIGGFAQASAAKKAAAAQERVGNRQIDLSEKVYGEQKQEFAPYREAGKNYLGAYNYEMGLGPKPADYAGYTASPGYGFQLSQGIGAIDASAAARGNLLSGSTLQGLQTYGQGLASQDWNNHMNRLAGGVASGQNAAGMQASAGQNYVSNASNALDNIGNAQAAGAIGVGNAFAGATDNLMSAFMFNNMMKKQ